MYLSTVTKYLYCTPPQLWQQVKAGVFPLLTQQISCYWSLHVCVSGRDLMVCSLLVPALQHQRWRVGDLMRSFSPTLLLYMSVSLLHFVLTERQKDISVINLSKGHFHLLFKLHFCQFYYILRNGGIILSLTFWSTYRYFHYLFLSTLPYLSGKHNRSPRDMYETASVTSFSSSSDSMHKMSRLFYF